MLLIKYPKAISCNVYIDFSSVPTENTTSKLNTATAATTLVNTGTLAFMLLLKCVRMMLGEDWEKTQKCTNRTRLDPPII